MSQTSAPVSMLQTPATTHAESSRASNIERIFDTALKSYKKKTKKDLKNHDIFKQLETCDSPASILAVFQATEFDPSQTGSNDRLKKWLVPTINVLCAFSDTLGGGVSLAFPPAKVVITGVGVLLSAAKGVAASQDILIDIFGRIESFFVRLEIYTEVPLTPAMTDKMVEITVEILSILGTATKEMEQSPAKKFLKRVAGRTDLEDGLKKLEKLTNEEIAMAIAQNLKLTYNIDTEVTRVGEGVNSILQQAADVKRNQLRERLRKWQSPPDPSTNHNIVGDRQHEGTAEWFIDSDTFEKWTMAGSLLWIHGKPGSGKSVLCSAVINHIINLCEAGSASRAYFYFDFRDLDKQNRRNILSSLLVQLSTRSDAFCDVLSQLYETHGNGAHQPSDKALAQCLEEMLALPNQGPVYLVIDALDECPDTFDVPSPREQVLDLVKDLVCLRFPGLHICVTSRPEVDICDVLESLASQTVSLQDEDGQKKDIADYVRSIVYSGSGKFMRRWRKEDKEHVIETLSERADGMFRWVFCQLEMLRNCLPQNVRRVLRELPASLDETYERMLREILKANPDQAYRLLQCLTVATRPLRVEELADVLALDFDGAKDGIPVLNKDWLWDDEQHCVLSTCSSLIVVVDAYMKFSKTRVVQFAHFSVKEFLTSDRLAKLKADISRFHIRLEPAHTVIAQACLGILLRPDYKYWAKSYPPLSDYAAQHWVDHAQFKSTSLCVEDGMRRLFDPAKSHFSTWVNTYDLDDSIWTSFLHGEIHVSSRSYSRRSYSLSAFSWHVPLITSLEDDASLCLYYAALCGLDDITKHLIAKYPEHLNAKVGRNRSPLVAALYKRHFRVAELLHQHGAVLPIGHNDHTLLHAASMDGSLDVVQWLLGIGADVNAQDNDHKTPLHFAIANGHLDVVKLLIQNGAGASTDLHTLLLLASSSRSAKTVQFFIRLGANVNARDERNWTPLHAASCLGHDKTVQMLIEHGADVNTQDRSHETPLYVAAHNGHSKTVQLLIGHGADVNTRDCRSHMTPLHAASLNGYGQIVQLLVEHGLDVDARDESHSTSLHLAASKVCIESMRILIKHGADVHARDQNQSTPLHMVSSSKALSWLSDITALRSCVRLLIEHGARVNAYDRNHKTPLHLAVSLKVFSWNKDLGNNAYLLLLLLENGADVDVEDDNGLTPIQIATSKGHHEIAQLLLDHSASVE